MSRPDRPGAPDGPGTEVERLLSEIDPPPEVVHRVASAALADSAQSRVPEHPVRSRLPRPMIAAATLLLLALPVVWLGLRALNSPNAPADGASVADAPYELTNREGVLVLRSPSGSALHVSGTARRPSPE